MRGSFIQYSGVVTFLFLLLTNAQRDINVPFVVAKGVQTRSGSNNGSCGSTTQWRNPLWNEAVDMAKQAITSMNNYGSDQVVRATLQTYFGIQPDMTTGPPTILAADQGVYNYVFSTYEKIVSFAENNQSSGNPPSMFCDDSWLVKTDRAYELNTGRDLGMTLSTMFSGAFTYGYWSPLLKNYAVYTPGPRFCGVARSEAYTLYGKMQSITLCPWLFDPANSKMKPSLNPYLPPNPVPPLPLQNFASYGSTMLHELAHLVSNRDIIDQPVNGGLAYGTRRCATLAQQDSNAASHNADSYRWFATAMFLPQWDWSRSMGGLTPVPT